jgi:hypothetical protein
VQLVTFLGLVCQLGPSIGRASAAVLPCILHCVNSSRHIYCIIV